MSIWAGRTALVGATGLVGGNLLRHRDVAVRVNSRNTEELTGRFGTVVFSAARAEKWKANKDPAADRAHIGDLQRLLEGFTCERLVVISTVDVYRQPAGVDESTPIDLDDLQPYGAHRFLLEETARRLHPQVLVLRLPGLYGPGLKKNVVFDLMTGNRLEAIQPASVFQYYGLHALADDIERALAAGLTTANLATEPVSTAHVMREAFGIDPTPRPELPVVRYDVRTRFASAFDATGDYLAGRDEVLAGLARFARTGVAA